MSELRPILPKTTTLIPLSNNDICVTSLIQEKIREYMMKGQANKERLDSSSTGDSHPVVKKHNEYSCLIKQHINTSREKPTSSAISTVTGTSTNVSLPPPLVPKRIKLDRNVAGAIFRKVEIITPPSTEFIEEEMVGSTTGDILDDRMEEEDIIELGEDEAEEDEEFDDAIDSCSNSSKMHILEDEEEEGEEVFALPSGGGDTGAPSITALKNGGGGVLNGDLPETPPSDMDEEMKEEEEEEEMEVVGRENGDSILATNGKSSTALTPPPKVKPSENGNSDETSCDKIEDNEDVEMGEEKEKLNGREQHVDETDKAIPASNPTEKKPSDTGTEAMARPVAKTRRNSNDESSGDKLEETETQIAKDTKNEAKEIDNETSNKQDTDHKNDAAEDCVDKDGLNDELKLNTDGEKTNVDDKSDKKEELHGTTKEDDCAKETRSEDKAIAEGISSEVDSESKANECTPDTEETTEKQDEDAAERSDKLTKSGVKEEESQQDDDDGDRQIDKDTDTVVKKKTRKSSVDSKSCTETIRNDMEYGESLQNETEDNSVSKELAVTENQSGERDEDLTSPSTAELNELMLANNMEITICKTSTPPPTGEKSNNLVNTTESSLSGDLKRRRSSTSSNHSNHSSGSNSSNKHHHHPSSKQQCTSSTVSVPSRPNSRSGNSATPPSGETSRNSTSERNSANGLSTPLQIELSRTDSGASENDRDSASEAESLVLEAASKAAASLEAELMLAKCTDGEVTITKSGTSTPALAPVVMGGSEQRSSVSDLRMMRRSDLKRTLSSDVRTSSGNNNNNNNSNNNASEGEGGGESEIETKRAHLSGGEEEMMVTVQYEPDLTEPMEGEEDDREKLVRNFVESAMKSSSDPAAMVSKLKKEIHVLSELAHAKEIEWNSILRLKKLKEEMWERLNRKMRVEAMGYTNNKRRPSTSSSPSLTPSSSSSSSSQNKPPSSSSSIKSSHPHPHPSVSPNINVANLTVLPSSVSPSLKNQRLILPKPTAQLTAQSPLPSPNADIILSEGRQGRIKDVQTIIADYRSKNPANEGLQTPVPKIRGRRSSTNSSRGSSHSSGSGSVSGTTHQSGLEASRYSNPSLLSMANLALGSGAIVRQPAQTVQQLQQAQQQQQAQQALDVQLNYLSNVQVQRQGVPQVKSQSMPLPPVAQPTFPEVTLHPVLPSPTQQQNSLLHGILTKTNNGKQVSGSPAQQQQQSQQQAPNLPAHLLPHPRSTSFSPTLARLLTAPERNRNGGSNNTSSAGGQHTGAQSFAASQNLTSMLRGQKMRQSGGGGQPCSNDIVASLKQKIVPQQSRQQQQQQLHLQQQAQQQQSEITITPVSNAQLQKTKDDSVVTLVEDEDETDRLIIDESPRPGGGVGGHSAQSASSAGSQQGEQIPECQGCHRNSAQFVCAGCGNQWYCSRECQVTAWEEHSDVCSG